MKKKVMKDDTSNMLRTYNDMSTLSAIKLKELCVKFNLDNSLPKKAKIVYLCHALGISTTGTSNNLLTCRKPRILASLTSKQREEFEQFSPKVLYNLPPTEWSSDISKIPEIEDTIIKKLLLETNVLDKASSRTYKLSRPFQLKQFVHSIKYFENPTSETFGIISARCNPSQATHQDDVKVVHIIIDKITGEPYSGYCTCTVGFSETCGHIGATLFCIADFVASGITELNNQLTCTEKLCKWSEPKGSKAEPETLDKLKIRKKTQSGMKRTADSYGQKLSKPEPPSYDDVAELHSKLINATHHLGQYCPAVHVLNAGRFRSASVVEQPPKLIVLEDIMEEDSEMLAYSSEISVESTPLPITRIDHKTFNSADDPNYESEKAGFIKKARSLTPNPSQIDILTKGQSNNEEWFEQRKGCITATQFRKVINVVEKGNKSDVIVNDILGKKRNDNLSKVPSIKWGRKHEEKARRQYLQKFGKLHSNLKIEEHGLLVFKHCNYIRGSPDGIVTCDCHADNRRLLEIKCPYSARYMTIEQAVKEKKIKYLQKNKAGKFELKSNCTEGYFEQMQGLMGIANIKLGNLVVWTTVDMLVVPVSFDPDFFANKLVPACEEFFSNHIAPEILLDSTSQESDSDEELTAVLMTCGTNLSMRSPPTSQAECTKINDKTKSVNKVSVLTQVSEFSAAVGKKDVVPHVYKCHQCSKMLPEEDILPDNSNASVGCDCPNCGGCDVWFCWPCAKYTKDWVNENIDWFCPQCTRECDLVY